MAISKAQAGNTATGTSTTPSATLTSGPTQGNAIVFTFSTGPAISSNGNLSLIAANSTASSVGILWMPVVAGTSGTQSITLVGSSAWDCRIDELTGSPSGAWQTDLSANSTSPGSETTRAFAGGTTSFPDEYAIAVAGFNISETAVPWNNSLANDTTNLLNGTRSLTVASLVLTSSGVSFSTLACGAWTTAGTTGGFAFGTLVALPAFTPRRPPAYRDPQVYTYFTNVQWGRRRLSTNELGLPDYDPTIRPGYQAANPAQLRTRESTLNAVTSTLQQQFATRDSTPVLGLPDQDTSIRPLWATGEAFYWPTPRQPTAVNSTIQRLRSLFASTPTDVSQSDSTTKPPYQPNWWWTSAVAQPPAIAQVLSQEHLWQASTPADQPATDADPTVTIPVFRVHASPYTLWWRDSTASQVQAEVWDRFGLAPSTPVDSGVQSDTGYPNTGIGRQSLFAWSFLSPRFPDAIVGNLGFYHNIYATVPAQPAPDADPTVTRRRGEEQAPFQLWWRDSAVQQAEQSLWQRWSDGANTPVTIPATTSWYLNLPGVTGAYASTPDSVANSIIGDIDIRIQGAFNTWAPVTTNQTLIAKRDGSTTTSYTLALASGGSAGKLVSVTSPDGTLGSALSTLSTATTGFAGGSLNWIRWTLDVNDGAGNRVYSNYTSVDYNPAVLSSGTWTLIGTTVTAAGTTTIFDSTSALEVGALNLGAVPTAGAVYRAQVLNGIGGTLAADMNPADNPTGASTWNSSTTGEQWALNGDATIRSTFENFNRDDVKIPWLYANPFQLRWPRDLTFAHVENSYAQRLRYATVTSPPSVDADPTVTIRTYQVAKNGYQLRWRDSTYGQITAENIFQLYQLSGSDLAVPDVDPTIIRPAGYANPSSLRWGRDSSVAAILAWESQLRLWYASTPTDLTQTDATVKLVLQNPYQLRQGLTASPWQMTQHLRRRMNTTDLGLPDQDTSLRPLWMAANGYQVRIPPNDWPAVLATRLWVRSWGSSTPTDLVGPPAQVPNWRALSPYQLWWRDSTRATITAFRLWRFSGEGKPFLPPDPGLLSFILTSTGVTNADLTFDGVTGLILVHDGRTFADVTVSGSTFVEIVDTGDTDLDNNTGRTSLKES